MSFFDGNSYEPGTWRAVCFECGRDDLKANQLRQHWQGYYVCDRCWEPRHPQDFVKAITDNQATPWAQPDPTYVFAAICSPEGMSDIAGYAVAGCAIAGYKSPMFDPSVFTNNVSTFTGT